MLCWAFDCVNDGSKVHVDISHVMHYVICSNNPMFFVIFNKRTRLIKGLMFHFKSNGITILRKHVDANHGLITQKFKE